MVKIVPPDKKGIPRRQRDQSHLAGQLVAGQLSSIVPTTVDSEVVVDNGVISVTQDCEQPFVARVLNQYGTSRINNGSQIHLAVFRPGV